MTLVLFRADASLGIGTGHVARCAALAENLLGRGFRIKFAARPLPHALADELQRRRYRLLEIPDAVGVLEEPAYLARFLERESPAVTVVDHYSVTAEWHRKARAWTPVIVAIEDLAASRLDADAVVNQNLGEGPSEYSRLVPSKCVVLVGPRYALLRPQFAAARGRKPRIRDTVHRVLVFMSGADRDDVTATAARAVVRTGVECDVVVGAAYPHFDRLADWARSNPGVTVYRNVADMASLMSAADLAVGAPSSASWERCCVGLPAMLVLLAENQVRAGAALAASGAARLLGWHYDVTEETIADALASVVCQPDLVAGMSRAAAAVTDGHGTERVASEIVRLIMAQS